MLAIVVYYIIGVLGFKPRYAPSSDLLAMLTKGVSLNSPVAIAPDAPGKLHIV